MVVLLKIIEDVVKSESMLEEQHKNLGLEWERLQDTIGHVGLAVGGWGITWAP